MKNIFIKDLKQSDSIKNETFMIKSIDFKSGNTGKGYVDLLLADKTGEISGKKWSVDLPDRSLKIKDIVEVDGEVVEYLGRPQLKVTRISKVDEKDITKYIKAAPISNIDMYNEILGYAMDISDSDLKKITLKFLEDRKEKLMYYPAAQRNHHAIYAGLLYHMLRMLRAGISLCKVYDYLRKDWVVAGVILHDLNKIDEIKSDTDGVATEYSVSGQLLGHIVMGVMDIDRVCRELKVDDEKRIMLCHMILSHHYEPEFGSPKYPMFIEAEMLHYLDMIDAKLYDFENILTQINPGTFSDKIWTLDNRRLYKDTLGEEEVQKSFEC